MSTTDLTAGDIGVSLQRLTGQENFNQWLRDFRIVADLKGVWNLYTGEQPIVAKPNRDAYIKSKVTRKTADQEITGTSQSPKTVDADELQSRLAEYKLDLDEYRDNEQKVRLAQSLLAFWVDPAIRGTLQEHKTPKAMWDWLKQQYRMNNTRALDIALSKMERLNLDDCKSVQDYLNKHELLKLDITSSGGSYDDKIMVSKILRGLNARFNTFVDQYYFLQDATGEKDTTLRELTSRLLTYESKVQERWEQKKAANKSKDKDNKSEKSENSSKSSGGDNQNGKNRSPTKAHKNKLTPFEALTGMQPSLTRERVWGSRAYVTTPPEVRTAHHDSKLHSPRGWLGYFVGCESETVYRIWNPDKKKIMRISAARIEDDEGADDQQPMPSLTDRVREISLMPEEQHDDEGSEPTSEDSTEEHSDQETNYESDTESTHDHDTIDIAEQQSAHKTPVARQTDSQSAATDDDDFFDSDNEGPKVSKFFANQAVIVAATGRFKKPVIDEDLDDEGFLDSDHEAPTVSKHFSKEPATTAPAGKSKQPIIDEDLLDSHDEQSLNEEQTYSDNSDLEREFTESKGKKSATKQPHGIVAGRVPNDLWCDRCMRKYTKCNGDRPCDACIKHKKNCKEQTKETKELIPKENRHLQSAHLLLPPTKCDHCTRFSRRCIRDDPNGPCNTCKDQKLKCRLAEEGMQHRCMNCQSLGDSHKHKCVRLSKDSPCERCKKDGIPCIPWKKASKAKPRPKPKATREPGKGICNECQKKKRHCDGESPCSHCKEESTECIMGQRVGVPIEDKCRRCRSYGMACNGKKPCHNCIKTNKDCLPQGLIEKCNRCRNRRVTCDGKKPCSKCIKDNATCGWQDELVHRTYNPERTLEEDEDECTNCQRAKRNCSGTEPCYRCVKHDVETCSWRRKGQLIERFEVAPFCLKDDNVELREGGQYSENVRRMKAERAARKAERKQANPNSHESDDTPTKEDDTMGEDLDEDLDEDLAELLQGSRKRKYAAAAITPRPNMPEPRNYAEAMKCPDAARWTEATEKEMHSMQTNNVFEVTDLPKGRKAISSRLVFRRKLGADLEILKHKVRLVARGFQQRQGVDFNEIYSGVVKSASYRILFALCAIHGWQSHLVDFVTAFLNAHLEEEIYVRPPPPYSLPKGKVWRMLRALYGFKQSPRAWYLRIAAVLKEMGFRANDYDQCVFINDERMLIVAIHIDDVRIFGKTEKSITQLKQEMAKVFPLTDEKEGSFYLGMHVEQGPGYVKLHQSSYIQKILERFQLEDIPAARTPCDTKARPEKEHEAVATAEFKTNYLQMFGSLNYLPTISRPDIAYAVSVIGRYNSNPNQSHVDAAARVYAYLKDTRSLGLNYTKDSPTLQGFVDSDYGGCIDTSKSTTGWVFMLGGAPVSWCSRRQRIVTQSSCEAEYVAASEAAKEAIWIKGFINNLRLPEHYIGAVPLHIDNKSALKLAKNPEMHQRTKHIAIKYHFIRQCVEEEQINIIWIKGTENPADAFTKALGRPKFEGCINDMRISIDARDSGGVLDCESRTSL